MIVVTALIVLYQKVISQVLNSVLVGAFGFHFQCRYDESCSHYTLRMVKNHGTISGLFFGVKRILGCWGVWNVLKSKQRV